jgi:hypothetical protein
MHSRRCLWDFCGMTTTLGLGAGSGCLKHSGSKSHALYPDADD